jgi:hypothetical protein
LAGPARNGSAPAGRHNFKLSALSLAFLNHRCVPSGQDHSDRNNFIVARAQSRNGWHRRLRDGLYVLGPRRRIETISLLGVLAVLVVSAGIGGWFAGLADTRAALQEAAPAPTEDDFRIGSITYVPVKGANCEVHRFDNFTGQVVPDGFVNCERKLNPEVANPMGPGTQRSERMRAILDTFKK